MNNHERSAEHFLSTGMLYESQGNLEEAYAQYLMASERGNARAMFNIGCLYLYKDYKQLEESNIFELMAAGMPIFPWNIVTRKVPDYKTALSWFEKAAALDHAESAYVAGSMHCKGIGASKDIDKGLALLNFAMAHGVEEAKDVILLYKTAEKAEYSDAQYERMLADFCAATDAGDRQSYDLYSALKGGNEKQLARLGYVLSAANSIGKPNYGQFSSMSTAFGIPLTPVAPKRMGWRTFIHVDLNAFRSDDVLISFASDIDVNFIVGSCQKLRKVGNAVYQSPEFGWLGEEKHAMLFKIDRGSLLDEAVLSDIAQSFHLIPEEYEPENAAFITECGEKEYSVEIAAITGGNVDILFRYTIGGSADVHEYFEPKLIEMDLSE